MNSHPNPTYQHLPTGFTILESILVCSLLISLISLGMNYMTKNAEQAVNQVTAQQLQQVTQAVQYYVQDHYQQFKNNSKQPLRWQVLVDQGYLPKTLAEKNLYAQTYHFQIIEDHQQLQIVLTTNGGNAISEYSMRQIAARAGAQAGYASALHPGKIIGNQQAWILDEVPLQVGHLASWIVVTAQEVMDASSFLRRVKIEGYPEYNQMETDLKINKNKSVTFGKGKFKLTSNQLKLNSDDGASILLSGDADKYIEIIRSSGEKMHLGSNYLTLTDKDKLIKLSTKNNNYPSLVMESNSNQLNITSNKLLMENKTNGSNKLLIQGDEGGGFVEIKDNNYTTGIYTNRIQVSSKQVTDRLKVWERNIDFGKSRLRSHMDSTGVWLPVYALKEGERREFSNTMCGRDANQNGKLFVVRDPENKIYLYICDNEFGEGQHAIW